MSDSVVPFRRKEGTGKKLRNARAAGRDTPDWEYLKCAFRAGASLRQLAEMPEAAGRSYQALGKYAKTHGWARDLTREARIEAQQRLALLRAQNGAETPEKVDADDRVETVAPPKPPKGSAGALGRAAPAGSSGKAFEAMVDIQVVIGKRQQDRIDRLTRAWEIVMERYEEYLDPATTRERREEIHAQLAGVKDAPIDTLTKLATAMARLQDKERVAFNMDAAPVEEMKPIVPLVKRRGSIITKKDDA